MGNIKEINIKNCIYYFFDDMINITNFDPNLLQIDKKSYKNTDIYYIGYIIMKGSDYGGIRWVRIPSKTMGKNHEEIRRATRFENTGT